MEGTTEPILAILGHPIAGNPSQFAIERAVREMGLEWRVLSFDVPDADIPAALNGLEVLGIRGVLVDPSVSRAVALWYAAKYSLSEEAMTAIDCLYRDDDGLLHGSCELGDWFTSGEVMPVNGAPAARDEDGLEASVESAGVVSAGVIAESASESDDESPGLGVGEAGSSTIERIDWIWLGADVAGESPSPAVPPYERLDLPPDPLRISAASFVVLADTGELEVEDWPSNDGTTIVMDLTEGHPERERLEELGYRFVDELERRSGTLCGCLRRWTGLPAPSDVIRDAIEEYMGV